MIHADMNHFELSDTQCKKVLFAWGCDTDDNSTVRNLTDH